MESKQNESFGNMIFSTDMIQETWTLHQERREVATRGEGAPPRARPLPRGPSGAPPMPFFLLYIHVPPND